jgi:threonine dehydrogenase-like Zn-dependent dehydrogenase
VASLDGWASRFRYVARWADASPPAEPSRSRVRRQLKEITAGLGADVCIDAVGAEADGSFFQTLTATKLKLQGGSPVVLNWCIDSVRKAGTVAVVGVYGPMFSAIKFGDALNKGLTIRANQTPVSATGRGCSNTSRAASSSRARW